MHYSYLTSVTFRVSLGSPIKDVKSMLQNLYAVIERAEASSVSKFIIALNCKVLLNN